MISKVAVVGLGSMGYGMARSLLRSGHTVWGVDIDPEPENRFRGEGGEPGPLPGGADGPDAVVIVVLTAAQTEEVLFGRDGIAAGLRSGAVVLGCATVAPEFARRMETMCGEAGLLYLDAPISGGSARAASGELTVMASGAPAARTAARPVLDAIAETVFDLGDVAGPGSAMKAVNQLLAGVHIAAMAEALTFGMTQGITPEAFFDVITRCAGTSWMIENRGPSIIAGDYTPHSQVDIWPKDLGIVLDIARSARFSAPLTAAAMQQFLVAAALGMGAENDTAVARVYARNAGLVLPGTPPA